MRSLILSFTLILFICLQHVQAEAWVRGSVVVLEASGEVQIEVPANGEVYDSFEQMLYLPGIFSSRAEAGGSLFIRTSNGMNMLFRGEGFFSIERFEGLLAGDSGQGGALVETQSRMIMNLRRGELLIDGRSLTGDSKCIVETPFGRILSVQAVLQVSIEYDYRSGIYDFTISCAEGSLRLSDKSGQVYGIYAGQRISGAGSYTAPAIEVAEQTEQKREDFERFYRTLEGLELKQVNPVKLRAQSRPIVDAVVSTAGAAATVPTPPSDDVRWPRVIEFAPSAEAITPFRGEVRPPSSYQADIF